MGCGGSQFSPTPGDGEQIDHQRVHHQHEGYRFIYYNHDVKGSTAENVSNINKSEYEGISRDIDNAAEGFEIYQQTCDYTSVTKLKRMSGSPETNVGQESESEQSSTNHVSETDGKGTPASDVTQNLRAPNPEVEGSLFENMPFYEIEKPLEINPYPSKLRKSDIIKSAAMFNHVDSHAAKVPAKFTKTINSLAEYLKNGCSNRLEIIRAIHTWIVKNISYDVKGFMTKDLLPCEPEEVLKNRCTVCSGYARLFVALCKEVSIPVVELEGYSKGFGYEILDPPTFEDDTDHAWNAVNIGQEWRLVDCTWNAGHLDNNGQFQRHEKDFYFLCDPEVFLNDHFPYMEDDIESSQRWQLLEKTIDLKAFTENVKKEEQFYSLKIQLLSHKNAVISTKKETVVRIRGQLKDVVAELRGCDDGISYDRFVFLTQTTTGIFETLVRTPEIGAYSLTLSGNTEKGSDLDPLVVYVLNCTQAYETVVPFPSHEGIWGPIPEFRDYGFDAGVTDTIQFLAENGEMEIFLPVKMDIELPLSELVHAEEGVLNSLFVYMEKKSKGILVKVRMAKTGYYKLTIFAKNLRITSDDYDSVINYLLLCKIPMTNCCIYPEIFPHSFMYNVTILEPLNGNINRNSNVNFRFRSGILKHIMLDTELIPKSKHCSSDTWECSVNIPDGNRDYFIFGNDSDISDDMHGLFRYVLV